MKKVIYLLGVFSFIISSLLVSNTVEAQNVGSLRSVVTPGFAFTMDLQPGYTDQQVLELQRVLNADVDTTISLSGEGARGRETKYFGNQTKQAVIKFQEKYRDTVLTPYGLTKGTGIVGKATRTRLNLLIGVIDTYASVGSPESRGSSMTVTTPGTTNTVATQSSGQNQSNMSTCSFVQLLINIEAISNSNSDRALNIMGCSNSPTLATGLKPSVDIKANYQDGPVVLTGAQNVTYSWSSRNVDTCRSSTGSRPTYGSTSIYTDKTNRATISCTGPYGTVSDSVTVVVSSANNNQSTTTNQTNTQQDYSYLNNTPTTTNKVLQSEGKPGDMVSIKKSTALNTTNKLTLEAWVNPSGWNSVDKKTKRSDSVILSKGEVGSYVKYSLSPDQTKVIETKIPGQLEYALSLDNGKLGFSNQTGGLYTCQAVVPLNKWTHVAATVDESTSQVKLYVDGQEVTSTCNASWGALNKAKAINEATNTVSSTSANSGFQYASASFVSSYNPDATINTGNIHIANLLDASFCTSTSTIQNGFKGKIDDVRIWNLARTSPNIASSTKTSVSNVSGLVAEYNFDNATFKNSVVMNIGTDGFSKGNTTIAQDFTSPAPLSSGSPSYSSSLGFAYSEIFSGSTQDPDGSCPSKPQTLPEEGGTIFSFGGKVKAIEQCTPVHQFEGKLWQVEIKPCQVRDRSLDNGESDDKTQYIVIREGHQQIPKVGDLILGRAVHDKALACKNAITPTYMGTATGVMGSGKDEGKVNCSTDRFGNSGSGGGVDGGAGFNLEEYSDVLNVIGGGQYSVFQSISEDPDNFWDLDNQLFFVTGGGSGVVKSIVDLF